MAVYIVQLNIVITFLLEFLQFYPPVGCMEWFQKPEMFWHPIGDFFFCIYFARMYRYFLVGFFLPVFSKIIVIASNLIVEETKNSMVSGVTKACGILPDCSPGDVWGFGCGAPKIQSWVFHLADFMFVLF